MFPLEYAGSSLANGSCKPPLNRDGQRERERELLASGLLIAWLRIIKFPNSNLIKFERVNTHWIIQGYSVKGCIHPLIHSFNSYSASQFNANRMHCSFNCLVKPHATCCCSNWRATCWPRQCHIATRVAYDTSKQIWNWNSQHKPPIALLPSLLASQ